MNSGNNGISCSSVSSLLLELSIFAMDMTPWTSLYLYGFLEYGPLQCSDAWNVITWSSLIFSNMIYTWIHLLLIIWHPLCYLIAFCLFPCSIWYARHAWTLPLTPRSIMILHQHECEPMTSAHWPCKHDVCPAVYHLNNCLVTQVLSATRYVKISRKFIIHSRSGSYGCLEEEKRLYPKTS